MRKLYIALLVVILSASFLIAVDPLNSNKFPDQTGIPERSSSSVLNLVVLEASNNSKFSEGEQIQLEVRYYTQPPPSGFLESLYNLSEGDRVRISTQERNWTSEFISRETMKEIDSVDKKINVGNSPDWDQKITFLPRG